MASNPLKTVLKVANAMFSANRLRSAAAFVVAMFVVFEVFVMVIGVAGVPGSTSLLVIIVAGSVIVASGVFALRGLRWNLVALGIGMESDWIKDQNPALIIGVGPGGAIIAGMIAKRLAVEVRREPLVFVMDRVFRTEGRSVVVQLGRTARIDVNFQQLGGDRVLVVTSEVHAGNTMAVVCRELDEAGLRDKYATFSFIVSPHARFRVDRHVLRSDDRGILPWPDAPAREGSH